MQQRINAGRLAISNNEIRRTRENMKFNCNYQGGAKLDDRRKNHHGGDKLYRKYGIDKTTIRRIGQEAE